MTKNQKKRALIWYKAGFIFKRNSLENGGIILGKNYKTLQGTCKYVEFEITTSGQVKDI